MLHWRVPATRGRDERGAPDRRRRGGTSDAASAARRDPRRSSCPTVHADRSAVPHPAFRLRYVGRAGANRPRQSGDVLPIRAVSRRRGRPKSITARRSAPPILRWEQHSEFTTYTWEMPADPGGDAVPSGCGLAGHADAAGSAARPAAGRGRPASCWRRTRRAPRRNACSTTPALRWRRTPMARRSMPPISSPGRPASCASWSPIAACPRSGPARWCSASIEARDLSHAGPARPARSAAARAFDRGLRAAAGRSHRTDAPRRRSRRQSPAARRIDRAGRGSRGGRRRERIPLRRQPRL